MRLKGWQRILLIQGLPACIVGVCTLAILRDTISENYWLSPNGQTALRSTLEVERSAHASMSLWDALLDKRILLLAIEFGFVVGWVLGCGHRWPMAFTGYDG